MPNIEYRGHVTLPVEPVTAWTPVITDNGFTIGKATENVRGYSPLQDTTGLIFPTWKDAQTLADTFNENDGLAKERANEIIVSSMVSYRRRRMPETVVADYYNRNR
jgi:hypothetical protein